MACYTENQDLEQGKAAEIPKHTGERGPGSVTPKANSLYAAIVLFHNDVIHTTIDTLCTEIIL